MKLNAAITLSFATVVGPRITIIAIWRIAKSELDSSLTINGMTLPDLAAKMQNATANSVCGQPADGAFVRLGGQIEYVYRTLDGFDVIRAPVISCPNPP